jgi:multimeric flavodoxin WrbA
LVSRILEGAKEVGAQGEELFLADLKIGECDGCDSCWKSGRCVQDDDMSHLYSRIPDFDAFVFGTPLYWYGPTALMKVFMDRLYWFCGGRNQGRLEGKEAALAIVFEEKDPQAARPTIEMFRLSFSYLKWSFREPLIVPGVGAKGEILKQPEFLERALTLGREMAR